MLFYLKFFNGFLFSKFKKQAFIHTIVKQLYFNKDVKKNQQKNKHLNKVFV